MLLGSTERYSIPYLQNADPVEGDPPALGDSQRLQGEEQPALEQQLRAEADHRAEQDLIAEGKHALRQIVVLSEEIDRLQKERMNLIEELNICRLEMSQDSALDRQIKEHHLLLVLLFAEI